LDATATRERILEAARRLFHEQGDEGTAVSTILREAGVHSGSLYHAFPGKEALLSAVLETYPALLAPVVTGPVEATHPDPVERGFGLLAFYRRGLEASGCRLGCPIGNLALEVSDRHPEVRPLIERYFAAWAGAVERWLAEAGGRHAPDADRADLARFVLTVMEGAVMRARAAGSLAAFDASVQALRRHFDLLEERAYGPRA
jgi:TetR/AcrR family transcriptional repressor of nem operon